MIKISWYKYAIISMIIAAVFGITLGMGTTCLIPVSFAVLGCSAYENFHNDLSYKKSLLEGGLPSLIGGIIIWICFLLAQDKNFTVYLHSSIVCTDKF